MLRYVFGGLMAIAMASVASAGHKPGHSAGGGGGGGATTLGDSFVVVDSTGQIIRHTTIDDNLSSAFVAVDVQFLGETVTVLRQVDQNGMIGEKIIRYKSSDCSGQPHIWVPTDDIQNINDPGNPPPLPTLPSSMLPGWKNSAIIIDPFAAGGPNLDVRLVFFIDDSQMTLDATISYLNDAGDCISTNQTEQWSVPVIEVQFSDFREDLHVLYPPPYRICAADDTDCITGP